MLHWVPSNLRGSNEYSKTLLYGIRYLVFKNGKFESIWLFLYLKFLRLDNQFDPKAIVNLGLTVILGHIHCGKSLVPRAGNQKNSLRSHWVSQ